MAEPHDRAAFKAGLFIFAMAILAVVMVFLVRGFRGSIGDTQEVTVVFGAGDNAAALAAGSQVRIYGVGVGTIASAQVIPDEQEGALVEVVAQLPAGFEVMRDAEVVASASLTGESWLNFVTLGSGEPMGDGGRIRGSSGGFEKALNAVNDALPAAVDAIERVNEVADRFDGLIARIDAKVDPLASDVQAFADAAAGAASRLDTLLGDSGSDLRTTFRGLAGVADSARERVPPLLDDLNALVADADATVEKIEPLIGRVGPVIGDTRAVVSDLRGLVRTNAPGVNRTVRAVERTAVEAQGAVGELRAAPWRLIYRPRERDQRNLALYAAARGYAAGAQDLEATADALRVALETLAEAPVEGGPEQAVELSRLRREVVDAYEDFEAVQARLWQQFER